VDGKHKGERKRERGGRKETGRRKDGGGKGKG
jgi:hypothetical protein